MRIPVAFISAIIRTPNSVIRPPERVSLEASQPNSRVAWPKVIIRSPRRANIRRMPGLSPNQSLRLAPINTATLPAACAASKSRAVRTSSTCSGWASTFSKKRSSTPSTS